MDSSIISAFPARNKLGSITGILTKNANGFIVDTAFWNQIDPKKIANPLRIHRIIFVFLDRLYPFVIAMVIQIMPSKRLYTGTYLPVESIQMTKHSLLFYHCLN